MLSKVRGNTLPVENGGVLSGDFRGTEKYTQTLEAPHLARENLQVILLIIIFY